MTNKGRALDNERVLKGTLEHTNVTPEDPYLYNEYL